MRNMEIKNQVLEAMKKAQQPLNAGKVVELTKLDRKDVDKAMKMLKDEGSIVSPKRCFWEAK
ncbi:transcriptional regulator [Flavobacterium piscisymbiosum]|uniref:Transcriptional regulator n=1 Tax=Flavobacterium piscisymbiosum TaxID=2893753 RepID=A0ABS8MB38_9FLAO|nr:transcriptional regulator [Flavobacterium sp. F-30]MCC9062747.1 transcriptional regulator [Flavobacterium sp. F-30]